MQLHETTLVVLVSGLFVKLNLNVGTEMITRNYSIILCILIVCGCAHYEQRGLNLSAEEYVQVAEREIAKAYPAIDVRSFGRLGPNVPAGNDWKRDDVEIWFVRPIGLTSIPLGGFEGKADTIKVRLQAGGKLKALRRSEVMGSFPGKSAYSFKDEESEKKQAQTGK